MTQQQEILKKRLEGRFTGILLTDSLSRALYSSDASIYQIEPLAVALPATEQDIVNLVNVARHEKVSVVPRGGGSGVAGESLGSGIILDFSRFMNRIGTFDSKTNRITVQAGAVLERLNAFLAALGRQVGPDPATGNRATMGGMLGNNSTGAHSLKYGYMADHIHSLKMVTCDGRILELEQPSLSPNSSGDWEPFVLPVYRLLSENKDKIDKARPRSNRNGSGYNIFKSLKNGQLNLAQLLAGSEGTLGIITELTLNTVPVTKVKALLEVCFDTLAAMARSLPEILAENPAACELMDGTLLKMAREAYPQYRDTLPEAAAALVVEFDGINESEVREKCRLARKRIEGLPENARSVSVREVLEPSAQQQLWKARKAAVPLLYRHKSAAQPIPVVEDVAVNPEQIGEYLAGLESITRRLEVPMAYYGHAGHGELHPRPYLDLHRKEDVRKLHQLANEVFKLAWSLGGSISGEHGEGLVRVSFIEKQYGSEIHDIFRRIKTVFDPENRFNPGKIINDDPDVMTKNLRFAHPQPRRDSPTELVFRDNEFVSEIEQCNGNGLCRTFDPQLSMCPIFRATEGDEDASPRAKGNLMRHWYYGLLNVDAPTTPEFKRIADLCVNCKMCALQCPSLVNIPKLMVEARARYVRAHGLPRAQQVLTRSELLSIAGSHFAPVANVFNRAGWFRRLLQTLTQLDHRRPLPAFDLGSNFPKLRRYLRSLPPIEEPQDKVAYFVDLYAAYNDHELGRATVNVLRHNNVEVIIPPQKEVGMPALSYGALDRARRIAGYNIKHLAEVVRNGYKIIASEPTAALCLKEEYLDLFDTEDADIVAANTYELTDYLADLKLNGRLKPFTSNVPLKLAYHAPCHYQALHIEHGTLSLLAGVPGLSIMELPESCCGIAGTFGFQQKGFDLSMRAGEPMLGPLCESDADAGLTECSTCKMQMELGSGKNIIHPIKILTKAYGISSSHNE